MMAPWSAGQKHELTQGFSKLMDKYIISSTQVTQFQAMEVPRGMCLSAFLVGLGTFTKTNKQTN